VSLYRDIGVVLRVQKLGEADRIVTLLTRRHGRVRAVAKGVRRTTPRFGARLEPFGHVDVQCYTGRTLDVVTQVVTVDGFGSRLVTDYGRYTTGCGPGPHRGFSIPAGGSVCGRMPASGFGHARTGDIAAAGGAGRR
jgi:hypothetical protein